MKATTYLTAAEVDPARVRDSTAVVVDVIRATSTMVEALANGARAIYPTLSTEEAINLATSLGRDDALLCGERKGLKVEGFDLGNSPREFEPAVVEGKSLVMSTTNGTRALLAAEGAERILAGSLLNLSAVARAVEGAESVSLICAGKEDRFSLDDALCAGMILRAILEAGSGRKLKAGKVPAGVELNDASLAVLSLAGAQEPDAEFLRRTAAGAALVEIGLEDDLPLCAEVDRHGVVPEMEDRVIRAAGEG